MLVCQAIFGHNIDYNRLLHKQLDSKFRTDTTLMEISVATGLYPQFRSGPIRISLSCNYLAFIEKCPTLYENPSWSYIFNDLIIHPGCPIMLILLSGNIIGIGISLSLLILKTPLDTQMIARI